jgi:hypothetical protein
MFIGGHWEDNFVRECDRRRLHCFRVPGNFDTLRGEITRVLGLARRTAADPLGPWQAVVEALATTARMKAGYWPTALCVNVPVVDTQPVSRLGPSVRVPAGTSRRPATRARTSPRARLQG